MTQTLAIYRGDTLEQPFEYQRAGVGFSLVGCSVYFTVKSDPKAPDASAEFQGDHTDGGIVVTDALTGKAKMVMTAAQTGTLVPGKVYYWDVQVIEADGGIYTPLSGKLKVQRDITQVSLPSGTPIPFPPPTPTSFSNLPLLTATRGALVVAQENLGFYQAVDGFNLAPDGMQVVNGVGGQWVRVQGVPHFHWLSQPNWAVDPVNGDDLAPGTPAQPIKSWPEFQSRVNGGMWSPSLADVAIEVRGDFNSASLAWRDISWKTSGTKVTVSGAESARTTLYTGTFTAVQAYNAATNTPLQITDSAANFGTEQLGLLEITSGPNAGAIAGIARRISSTTLRLGYCAQEGYHDSPLVIPTAVVPQVGETYRIQAYPQLQLQTIDNSFGGVPARVGINFRRLMLTAGASNIINCSSYSQQGARVYACDVRAPSLEGRFELSQCKMHSNDLKINGTVAATACGIYDAATLRALQLGLLGYTFGAQLGVQLTQVLIEGRLVARCPVFQTGSIGIFPTNVADPLVALTPGSYMLLAATGSNYLWGVGSNYGVALSANSSLIRSSASVPLPVATYGTTSAALVGATPSTVGTWADAFNDGLKTAVGAGCISG